MIFQMVTSKFVFFAFFQGWFLLTLVKKLLSLLFIKLELPPQRGPRKEGHHGPLAVTVGEL